VGTASCTLAATNAAAAGRGTCAFTSMLTVAGGRLSLLILSNVIQYLCGVQVKSESIHHVAAGVISAQCSPEKGPRFNTATCLISGWPALLTPCVSVLIASRTKLAARLTVP
jgi:hypothetical protein